MTDLILLYVGLALALFATGAFLYGFWTLMRSTTLDERIRELAKLLGLSREELNPILSSREQAWEEGGVMNPAVIRAGGKTHMFYRAVGADGVSRIGYASSRDGIHIDERLPYPVFALANDERDKTRSFAHHSGLSASGGSYAGVEDPRAVVIDDRMYLTFSAFRGWDSLRIAVSSISLEDLFAKRWKWSDPVYLSPPGEVHKNWVLFPEKVNGAFSVLHGFEKDREHASVAHLSTLTTDPSPYIQSEAAHRDAVNSRVWDSRIRGAGPPPVKTKKGWLVLYHANDSREPHRYKLGAMLLDLLDPSKVLARSPVPVLAPDTHYENDGKAGVVYACGATVDGDTLRVYYGGGDKVVCTASSSLSKLLRKLVPVEKTEHVLHPAFLPV